MPTNPIYLGVNVDHIATLRQARLTRYPDPLFAVQIAETAGADSITIHLREDRRHIQDQDVRLIRQTLLTRLNLEMALTDEMLQIAEETLPHHCCFVPEKRAELTTEGGLNVVTQFKYIENAIKILTQKNIAVSLFIDPDLNQIEKAVEAGAKTIELNTGRYAEAPDHKTAEIELTKIIDAVNYATKHQLQVNAGHGLHYHNVEPIARIVNIHELNIGHAIISRALFVGLHNAVYEMKRLMVDARYG